MKAPTTNLPRRLPLVVVAATLISRLPGLVSSRAFNTDEATLAVLGRTIFGHGTIYVSAIDHKPPLAFFWYGLVQTVTGSTDLRFVRGSVLLLVIAAALVLADEAGRRWGATAAWTAALATVLACALLGPADAQAANFELFALLPIAMAVVAAARGHAVLAGVALAVAVSCKQPAAFTAIPVAWTLWRLKGIRGVATTAGAGAVSVLVLWAPFNLGRVVEWALLRNEGYLSMSAADLQYAGVRALASLALVVGFWCGAWVLVVGNLRVRRAAATPALPGPDGSDPDVDLTVAAPARTELASAGDAWLLLAASVVAVVPGFRFFPHYLIQLVPAVALLAARGSRRRRALLRPAIVLTALCALVAMSLAWIQVVRPVPAPEVAVARYVEDNTRPDDRVFVWGNMPEIYWRSDRLPAGGLTHNNLLTGYSGRRPYTTTDADVPDVDLYRELVDHIEKDRPVLVVDIAVSGVRGGDRYPLSGYRRLASFVADRYEPVASVGGAVIYRRRP